MLLFTVDNDKTWIQGASSAHLQIFDRETSYPTDLVITPGVDPKDFGARRRAQAFRDAAAHGWDGWDGWVHLLHVPKTIPPWFPTGLLDKILEICQRAAIPYQVHDRRVRPEENVPESCLQTIVDRDYQIKAVEAACRLGRGVLDMPPRAGKTRTACEIQRRLNLRTIWLAPTDRIVQQTRDVLEAFFGANYVHHQVGRKGEQEAARATVVVCTAATAMNLSPEFYATREIIVVDEFHHAAAKTYRDIFQKCRHIYYRFGMTGTFYRSGPDDMAMHALLGNTIIKVSPRELHCKGHLVRTHVVFLPVVAPKLRGLDPMFQTGHGKHGIQEHEIRNQLVVWVIVQLVQNGRRVLVLVGTKAQGYLLVRLLQDGRRLSPPAKGCEFSTVEFLSTDTPRDRQANVIESFLEGQEVKVLLGTSLLGEGVDLPSADALVYARGGSAEVTLVQNAYRVGTASPGKERAIIVDFGDAHHRKLMEHSQQRLRVYYDEPTFHVEVLQKAEDFYEWLKKVDGNP